MTTTQSRLGAGYGRGYGYGRGNGYGYGDGDGRALVAAGLGGDLREAVLAALVNALLREVQHDLCEG